MRQPSGVVIQCMAPAAAAGDVAHVSLFTVCVLDVAARITVGNEKLKFQVIHC